MRKLSGVSQICFSAAALFFLLAVATTSSIAQTLCATGTVCVTTWQNDNGRTGDNLNEGILTASSITGGNFGQLCSASLDGQVYAQPLVATNVNMGGINYPRVVYVVTQSNTLYAINGTPTQGIHACSVLGSLPFLKTSPLPTNNEYPVDCAQIGGKQCSTIAPTVGILGTPVLSVSNGVGTIYLVTYTQDVPVGQTPSNWYHYLYAVDIQSLTATAWVKLLPAGQGSGIGGFSQTHIQRPALLFANCGSSACGNANYVYVAFAMMDGSAWPYPNGAIFGFNATKFSTSPLYFQTSIGGQSASYGGGFWMGGAGPAFGPDSSGQKN